MYVYMCMPNSDIRSLSLPYSVRLGVVVSVSNEGDRTYSHLGDGRQACLQGSSCPTATGVHLGSLEDSEFSNSLWQGFPVVPVLRHGNLFFYFFFSLKLLFQRTADILSWEEPPG